MICSQPIHYSDGKGEETVPVSGGFGVQRSVAPARGEELEQIMSRVWEVCNDFPCPFPGSGGVQVLDGGEVGTNNHFCRPDRRCSLFLFSLVADPNQTVMEQTLTKNVCPVCYEHKW